jgi:hypothetical protein
MKLFPALLLFAATLAAQGPFTGRWDLTFTTPQGNYPGWLEVTVKDGAPQVRFQPRGGSVGFRKNFKFDGDKLTLEVQAAQGQRPATVLELTAKGGALTGTQTRGGAPAGTVQGERAPELNRPMPKAWSKPEPIFNGKDLAGWEPDRPERNNWTVQDGLLVNLKGGANLRTTRKFDDFKLHVELNCPERGNSGIYLRGRYEMQVEYEPEGVEDKFHRMGAIYGMAAVTADVPRTPGQWETFDITFVGRRVTVVRNGVTVINDQELAGITGGALDSKEGEPGPFYIQGDHTGGIKFRNITVATPLR